LHTLNSVLSPDYEIRCLSVSNGSDTLIFLPLKTEMWQLIETEFPEEVSRHFVKIAESPNLFTESWGILAPRAKRWWEFWK